MREDRALSAQSGVCVCVQADSLVSSLDTDPMDTQDQGLGTSTTFFPNEQQHELLSRLESLSRFPGHLGMKEAIVRDCWTGQ